MENIISTEYGEVIKVAKRWFEKTFVKDWKDDVELEYGYVYYVKWKGTDTSYAYEERHLIDVDKIILGEIDKI